MKFRLANNPQQSTQRLTDGIGSAIQAFVMGDQIKQQAADEAWDAQAKRDLVGAQSRAALSQASKYDAEAGQIADQRTRASFPELVKAAAFQFGVPNDSMPELEQVLNTGKLPSQYQPPIDGRGPVMPAPDFLAPENLARIRQMVGGTNQALAVGDKSVKSIADAADVYRNMGLEDRALNGQVSPLVLAQTKYAMSGKAPFDFNEFGTGNNLTGAVDASNPAAQRFGQLRQSEIGENNAQADKYRAETDKAQREPSASAAAPSGYRWTPTGSLEAIPGGPGEFRSAELDLKARERQAAQDAKLASVNAQIAVIDKALNHPGRSTSTGLSGSLDPRNYIPGTDAMDFRSVLDQIGGTAFLQAFESLKGGGQITEMEGKKATDAIARLSRAQSDAEFVQSLNDLRAVMQGGLDRLKGAAPSGAAPAPSAPGGASASWDAPAGGKIMSMADVQATAQRSGRSVQDVIKAAQAKGYTVR